MRSRTNFYVECQGQMIVNYEVLLILLPLYYRQYQSKAHCVARRFSYSGSNLFHNIIFLWACRPDDKKWKTTISL